MGVLGEAMTAGLAALHTLRLDLFHYSLDVEIALKSRVRLLMKTLEIHYTTFLFCR